MSAERDAGGIRLDVSRSRIETGLGGQTSRRFDGCHVSTSSNSAIAGSSASDGTAEEVGVLAEISERAADSAMRLASSRRSLSFANRCRLALSQKRR